MKKILLSLLVLTFMVLVVDEADAQRRGKKKRRTRTEDTEQTDERSSRRSSSDDDYSSSSSIMDKLNLEIKPGNLFIGNNTSISVKANAGYKFTKDISAGIGGKYLYFWQSFGGSSVSASDYGGFGYVKAKVSREFYLVGEYTLMSVGTFNGTPRSPSFTFPSAGIGYMRPGIDWSSGFELLFIFSEEARNNLSLPLEYWFNFSYNF